MYRTADGQEIFVVDGHVHYWDGSRENWRNPKYAEGWLNCFYDYHKNLSPPEEVWPLDLYAKYPEEQMVKDLFGQGYVDVAIFQPTYLLDFYTNGWNTIERSATLKEKYPDKFILNGRFDPRDGADGLITFEEQARRYGFKGVKLYTAEWLGTSKGWSLKDDWAHRYLDKCVELGVRNIHVHKGPTIWPFNRDAFDVADVDDAATEYRDSGLRFIVDHCGLPRLEDFCWIAAQEPNVYGGLSVVMPFINARPRYFAEVLAELLWWLGEDRLIFQSDYALWSPKWLVDRFMAFEFPEDVKQQRGVDLTLEGKQKILGLNAARLYDLTISGQTVSGEALAATVPT
ncbi:MAG: amidohydrolase [Chloroflexi bacterium]|nr:amidohydrolase [Chloroflexota bacterium]